MDVFRNSLILLVAWVSSSAMANPVQFFCEGGLKRAQYATAEEGWLEQLDSTGKAILNAYDAKFALQSEGMTLLSRNEVLEIAAENDVTLYRERLQELLQEAPAGEKFEAAVTKKITKLLAGDGFTPAEIAARLKDWKNLAKDRWFRLLGDRTLEEIQYLYFGGVIGKISPESLIGKYIKKTGAATRVIQVTKRPTGSVLGPKKIVVAISKKSLKEFQKIAATPYFMSVLGHANVLHRGNVVTFGNAKSEFRMPGVNTPLPFLLLKTSESERLNRYLEYAVKNHGGGGWNNELKQPWLLPGYCGRGAYSCCTHWLGNIPIGDRRVAQYGFPANRDNGWGEKVTEKLPPIWDKLQPYKSKDEELKAIWKVPGNEQLSSVIGQMRANLEGEFASPGYVIHTLLGPTTNERVPIIFWVTKDHKAKIPAHPTFNFEDPH